MEKLSKSLSLKNVKFIGRVSYDELPEYLINADICLGIFGNNKKAKRVVTNKVYEILAMGKPLITGNSEASREILKNKENAILCEMGNPKSLASAILELKNDENLRNKIAKNGYILYKDNFTPKIIGKNVINIIKDNLEEKKR